MKTNQLMAHVSRQKDAVFLRGENLPLLLFLHTCVYEIQDACTPPQLQQIFGRIAVSCAHVLYHANADLVLNPRIEIQINHLSYRLGGLSVFVCDDDRFVASKYKSILEHGFDFVVGATICRNGLEPKKAEFFEGWVDFEDRGFTRNNGPLPQWKELLHCYFKAMGYSEERAVPKSSTAKGSHDS